MICEDCGLPTEFDEEIANCKRCDNPICQDCYMELGGLCIECEATNDHY